MSKTPFAKNRLTLGATNGTGSNRVSSIGNGPLLSESSRVQVYRWIDVTVYRKSTADVTAER